MARPSIAIALPRDEQGPVAGALREADLDPIVMHRPEELEAQLAAGRDIAVAILDGENDFDTSLEYYGLLHEAGRDIPALMVLSARALERVGGAHAGTSDEYFTRPYSAESIRWRVEAMMIRRLAVDDGSGAVIQTGPLTPRRLVAQRNDRRRLQPEGRRGQDDRRRQPRRGAHRDGPPRPPRRRRHGDRPHRQLARPGARPDPRRRGHRRAGGRRGPAGDPRRPRSQPTRRGCTSWSSPRARSRPSLLDPAHVAAAIDTGRRNHDVVVVDLHPDYDAAQPGDLRDAPTGSSCR